MNNSFLFIKGAEFCDVRMQKYLKYFKQNQIPYLCWGWLRKDTIKPLDSNNIYYLLKGGGYASNKLIVYYLVWMVVLFFRALFSRKIKSYNIVAVNFDSALPVFFASIIRRFSYSYEILDEFSLSYNFPAPIRFFTQKIDHLIMHHAKVVIHVDVNRITYKNCKYIVIENSPYDFYNGQEKDYSKVTHSFVVSGYLSPIRCVESILHFAELHPNINFIIAGEILDNSLTTPIKSLPNVVYYNFMPQDKLFELIQNCAGIFSLYRPNIQINRLAASNKVYDAMMLGIPVITNPEVINSSFILENKIGLTINADYDETWDKLVSPTFLHDAEILGRNGRHLYLERYVFDKMIKDIFIPAVCQ